MLSGSTNALAAYPTLCSDLYARLAQRLHHFQKAVYYGCRSKNMSGQGYSRMDNFKRMFRHNLMMVYLQYNAARMEDDDNGLTLLLQPAPYPQVVEKIVNSQICPRVFGRGVTGVWWERRQKSYGCLVGQPCS